MKEINMLTGRCRLYVLLAAVMVCCAGGCKDPCDGTQSCPGLQLPWFRDADGDGYSDGIKVCSLSPPGAGYYLTCQLAGPEVDCNDADPNVHSGATEVCDGVDNNCDGQIDEGLKITFYRDLDGDGYGNTVDQYRHVQHPLDMWQKAATAMTAMLRCTQELRRCVMMA